MTQSTLDKIKQLPTIEESFRWPKYHASFAQSWPALNNTDHEYMYQVGRIFGNYTISLTEADEKKKDIILGWMDRCERETNTRPKLTLSCHAFNKHSNNKRYKFDFDDDEAKLECENFTKRLNLVHSWFEDETVTHVYCDYEHLAFMTDPTSECKIVKFYKLNEDDCIKNNIDVMRAYAFVYKAIRLKFPEGKHYHYNRCRDWWSGGAYRTLYHTGPFVPANGWGCTIYSPESDPNVYAEILKRTSERYEGNTNTVSFKNGHIWMALGHVSGKAYNTRYSYKWGKEINHKYQSQNTRMFCNFNFIKEINAIFFWPPIGDSRVPNQDEHFLAYMQGAFGQDYNID